MPDGDDAALRLPVPLERHDLVGADKIEVRLHLPRRHHGRFHCAAIIFAEAADILFGERANFFGRLF